MRDPFSKVCSLNKFKLYRITQYYNHLILTEVCRSFVCDCNGFLVMSARRPKTWFCYYYKLVKLLCYWPSINIKWHTYISFLVGYDFHEHTAVITRPVGNQMNEQKPGTQENKHGALNDKTTFNDGAISSSNSVFFVCSFVCLFFNFNLFRSTSSCLFFSVSG